MRCPVCGEEVDWRDNPHRPFCSERCKLVDLGAWIQEGYSIAGGEDDGGQSGEDGAEGQE